MNIILNVLFNKLPVIIKRNSPLRFKWILYGHDTLFLPQMQLPDQFLSLLV